MAIDRRINLLNMSENVLYLMFILITISWKKNEAVWTNTELQIPIPAATTRNGHTWLSDNLNLLSSFLPFNSTCFKVDQLKLELLQQDQGRIDRKGECKKLTTEIQL